VKIVEKRLAHEMNALKPGKVVVLIGPLSGHEETYQTASFHTVQGTQVDKGQA
jgi:hypothetical protein